MATYLPSSSSYSSKGKSVTHKRFCLSSPFNPSFSAILTLIPPRHACATFSLSAINIIRSPAFVSKTLENSFWMPSLISFNIGDSSPASVTLIQAIPFAPRDMASLVRSSISFLDGLPMPVILTPFTTPPSFIALRKTLKFEPATMEVTSFNSRPNLVSGLSTPYLSIASLYVSLGKGLDSSIPFASLKRSQKSPSISSMISSLSTKDISRSTWVNSGCRSALRSSSLKHFTT